MPCCCKCGAGVPPRDVLAPLHRRNVLAPGALMAAKPPLNRRAVLMSWCAVGTLLPPRSTPTSAVLRSLEHVRNARDLAEATDRIAPGRIFRSACLNNASEADADALQQTLGISELVSVRIGVSRVYNMASEDCRFPICRIGILSFVTFTVFRLCISFAWISYISVQLAPASVLPACLCCVVTPVVTPGAD